MDPIPGSETPQSHGSYSWNRKHTKSWILFLDPKAHKVMDPIPGSETAHSHGSYSRIQNRTKSWILFLDPKPHKIMETTLVFETLKCCSDVL